MSNRIQAKGRRLFPADPKFAAETEPKLNDMVRICNDWHDGAGMAQGYTYLGQFLAHELVSREFEPKTERSRRLDLDSLYGKGAQLDSSRRFVYSKAAGSLANDLVRDPATKQALIPDFRNDDQVIICQLHLTFQLFHNAVMDAISLSVAGRNLAIDEQFKLAKEYVVATVQRIYVEEYLRTCSDPEVYKRYTRDGLRVFSIPDDESQLPFEITHAALRFGHSQIRDRYLLNRSKTVKRLGELFNPGGRTDLSNFQGIPLDNQVDWRRFFPWDGSQERIEVGARRINPNVTTEMAKLQDSPPNIVERNIRAGIVKALPPGQTVAAVLATKDIVGHISSELKLQQHDMRQKEVLQKAGLWEKTPLWLYILIEASGLGNDGMHLGPVGSVFLCETLFSAIEGQDYGAVQDRFNGQFGLRKIGMFRDLAGFAEPAVYGNLAGG
jgi:Animal haem peroxidase